MDKTVEEKIELMRLVLVKFVNLSELGWADRQYLQVKLHEIMKETE